MMNIKKLLSFLLVLAMLATLGGCANPPEEAVESSDGGMTIVAANFPAYDFARAVAGDANVTLLLPPGSEAHSYEPWRMCSSCSLRGRRATPMSPPRRT